MRELAVATVQLHHDVFGRVPTRDAALGRVERARNAWALTGAQARVLNLVAHGQTNKEVARELEIEEGTVEAHVRELFRKTGAKNRATLVYRFWTLES